MGDAAFAPKNGGLNIHNESIAAQAKGDAARATNLGDSTSTTKLLPPGNGGSQKIHNNSIASQKIICFRGDNNWGIAPWA